jgi:hypothetical protein
MHLQKIGPKRLANALPLNADWDGESLKVSAMSHCSFVFQGRNVTASTSEFFIEVRQGNGADVPYSDWQPLSLDIPLIVGNVDFDEVVTLTDLSFSEVRVRLAADAGSDGDFSVWVQARGFH